MNVGRTLLIARTEFVKYATRKGFILSVLLFPVWILLGAVVPQWAETTVPPRNFVVIDRAGGFVEAVDRALARRSAEAELDAISEYAAANADLAAVAVEHADIVALLQDESRSDATLARFETLGGWRTVFAALGPHLQRGAPPFDPPIARFVRVATPPDLADATGGAFSDGVRSYLSGERRVSTPSGSRVIFAVVVVPPDFAAGGTGVQYWSANLTEPDLRGFVRDALDAELRIQALQRLGPDAVAIRGALDASSSIESLDPTRAPGDERVQAIDRLKSLLPFALAFLLILTVFTNANVLLMGVIEEKANRVVETLLSCATAAEIMTGKLIGSAGIALTTIVVWGGGLLLAMFVLSPVSAALAWGALDLLFSVDILPMLLIYFVFGILIYASVFLAVGSMAASLPDAQAWLGPLVLVVFMPMMFLPIVMRDPNGVLATALSWIPIYTPFFMMFRLPTDPPVLEVVGATLLMAATATFLVWQMGRVFAANVLTTERPPRLGPFLARLLRRATGRKETS